MEKQLNVYKNTIDLNNQDYDRISELESKRLAVLIEIKMIKKDIKERTLQHREAE